MAVAVAGKLHRALTMLVLAGAVAVARGDFAADRAECPDKLMGLATCLTYVQATATARSPTPDCCAGLKTVVAASKKCLCVLVKDRDEPALGFQINVTRAMDLPDSCKSPATFSDCPKILNMAPDSPDAQVFREYEKRHESKNSAALSAAAQGAGRRREAAQHGPLPPRLGAARRSLPCSRVRTVWRMDWTAGTPRRTEQRRVGESKREIRRRTKTTKCTPFSCSFCGL